MSVKIIVSTRKEVVEKELVLVRKAVNAFVAIMDCAKGEVDFHFDIDEEKYSVFVDNDGKVAFELSRIIDRLPRAVVIKYEDYQGHYDWKSDTYIRPGSEVIFEIK